MVRLFPVAVLLVGLVASDPLASAAAQDASPVASPFTAVAPLDLAAMVLLPADLDQPGFALESAGFERIELQAAGAAQIAGLPVEEILDRLRAAGFVHRYNLDLARPRRAGDATPGVASGLVGTRITTSITEYTSAEGAAAGFDLLDRQAERGADFEDLPLTTDFGDEAELTRFSGLTPDTNDPHQSLNLTFRLDNLVADVVIQDLSNQQPEVAEAEALAVRLEDRIHEVLTRGGPGLSSQVQELRVDGQAPFEAYLVLDGSPVRIFDEPAAASGSFRHSVGNATDVYALEQSPADAIYFITRLHRFPTEEDAAAWLAQQPARTLADLGYVDVNEVTGQETLGDESRVVAYAFPIDPATMARGYAMYARVGAVVARIQVDSVPEAPLSAALELAEAQVHCLEIGRCPEPIPLPTALLTNGGGPVSSPEATPAA